MNARSPLSMSAKVTMFGLLAAATGVVIMMMSGVEFQTMVPPGLFLLLIPAGLLAVGRSRWTPVLATCAALFIFIGHFFSGATARLLEVSPLGALIGLWIQFLASLIAATAGIVASVVNFRARSSRGDRSHAPGRERWPR